eukprot:208887_1
MLSSLLRGGSSRLAIPSNVTSNLAKCFSASSHSALEKVKPNQVNVHLPITHERKEEALSKVILRASLLKEINNEEEKLKNLIDSISALQVIRTDKIKQGDVGNGFEAMNRSARRPRRANRGKRPQPSRQAREKKKMGKSQEINLYSQMMIHSTASCVIWRRGIGYMICTTHSVLI